MNPQNPLRIDYAAPQALVGVLPRRPKKDSPKRYLNDRQLSTRYTDSGSRSSTRLTVSLLNDDGELFFDKDLTQKGTILHCSYGYPGLMVDAGQFTIKEIKGTATTLDIEAQERKRSRMARKKTTFTWINTKRSEAVREVLLREFPASEIDVQDTGKKLESIEMVGEHDWQWLVTQAQIEGFEFWVDEKGAHWKKPDRKQKPQTLLRYIRNGVGMGEIIDYNFDGLGLGIPGRVRLYGREALTKKVIDVEVTAESKEIALDDIVIDAGPESPQEGDREARGDIGNEVVRNTGARSIHEAKLQASAMLKTARRGALKLSLTVVGDPLLRSRRVISVYGIGPALDGAYWLKEVTHDFSGFYTSQLTLTREGLAKRIFGASKMSLEQQLWWVINEIKKPGGMMRQWYGGYTKGM